MPMPPQKEPPLAPPPLAVSRQSYGSPISRVWVSIDQKTNQWRVHAEAPRKPRPLPWASWTWVGFMPRSDQISHSSVFFSSDAGAEKTVDPRSVKPLETKANDPGLVGLNSSGNSVVLRRASSQCTVGVGVRLASAWWCPTSSRDGPQSSAVQVWHVGRPKPNESPD